MGARPRLATLDSDGHPPAIYRTYVALTQSSINQQAIHQQQARLAGVDFNPAGLLGLQTERQAVQQQAAQAEQELATMVEEFQKLDAPIALQFNRLVSNYLKAFDCIQGVDKGNLANVLAALRIADSDTARFAEKVLLGFAMIRNGEDMSQGAGAQVVQELQRLAEVTQSSSVLGLSPINIDRMILSIWCQSDEKLTEEISFIKKDLESRKHPRVLYMLGIYHGSKRQFAEAKRFLRSARAKVDKDARKRGFISAEVLFFELCSDASKDLEAVADLVADVDAWQQNDPNSRMSWQLGRAKAVLASLEGRFDDAKQLVVESRAVAPPLGRKVLDSMSNSFNMNQRFTFESSPP